MFFKCNIFYKYVLIMYIFIKLVLIPDVLTYGSKKSLNAVWAVFGGQAWFQKYTNMYFFTQNENSFKSNSNDIIRLCFKNVSVWDIHICTKYEFSKVSSISETHFTNKSNIFKVKKCKYRFWTNNWFD